MGKVSQGGDSITVPAECRFVSTPPGSRHQRLAENHGSKANQPPAAFSTGSIFVAMNRPFCTLPVTRALRMMLHSPSLA